MSYAEVASKGPKQSPAEAAAPQPPQVVPTTGTASSTASSSSLIDVDTPSVHTVPSDFASQEIKTETQAARAGREEQAAAAEEANAAARARAEADLAAKKKKQKARDKAVAAAEGARAKARRAEVWLAQCFGLDRIPEGGAAGAVAVANFVAVLGVSGWLGYRAWGLYDRGRFGWREAGIGLGVVGAVGAVEGILASYFSKARSKEQ